MTTPEEGTPSRRVGDAVLKFLSRLEQRSEVELYLRIYRGLSRDEFALIIPSAEVLELHVSTLAEQLGQLRELGLVPHLLVGALDEPAGHALDYLKGALAEEDLEAVVVDVSSPSALEIPDLEGRQILVLRMTEPSTRLLTKIAERLLPRKVIFLRSEAGLGPHGPQPIQLAPGHVLPTSRSGIFAINLRSDSDDLRAARILDEEDERLLSCAEGILSGPVGQRPRATVSFTSPQSLLRELFTVSGDGTLIKLGAMLNTFSGYEEIDRERLTALLSDSFRRTVRDDFWERPVRSIHLESDYRGVALVEEGRGAAYLSKFAVLPVAQGEGLGQDLWWSLSRYSPELYWRARPHNPINAWYVNVADGVHKTDRWHVYWRGVEADSLPELIRDAIQRSEDFE